MKAVLLLASGILLGGIAVVALRPTPVSPERSSPSPHSGLGFLPSIPGSKRSAGPLSDKLTPDAGNDGESREAVRPVAIRGGGGTRVLVERERKERRNSGEVISREELASRAAKVEFEANRRLARWAVDLNLTEAQQDQAFAILARASDSYHPALEIEGDSSVASTAKLRGSVDGDEVSLPRAVEDQLLEIIDPAQQHLLEDELADRSLWWDDVVAYLEADLDASTAATAAAAAAAAAPVPSDYQGDDLSDLFGDEEE